MIHTDGTPTIASRHGGPVEDVVLGLSHSDARILQNLIWQVEDVSPREHLVRTYIDLEVAKGEHRRTHS